MSYYNNGINPNGNNNNSYNQQGQQFPNNFNNGNFAQSNQFPGFNTTNSQQSQQFPSFNNNNFSQQGYGNNNSNYIQQPQGYFSSLSSYNPLNLFSSNSQSAQPSQASASKAHNIVCNLFSFSMDLDQVEWDMDKQDVKTTESKINQLHERCVQWSSLHKEQEYEKYFQHLFNKVEFLKKKCMSKSSINNSAKDLNQLNFWNNNPVQQPIQFDYSENYSQINSSPIQHQSIPLKERKIVSFSIAPHQAENVGTPSLLIALSRISYFLRNNNEKQAMEEFKLLPKNIQDSIYCALWIIRGRPTPETNPSIAHMNFGEVSFFNSEERCASSVQQKACAIELCIHKAAILDMIELLNQNKFDEAIKIFNTLPERIQGEIFGKHWEVCGKPTSNSEDEELRKISHLDFGKVSFLGSEERCNMPLHKKAEALCAYLSQLTEKYKNCQEPIDAQVKNWGEIDKNGFMKGLEKNKAKKESLDSLAQQIVPLFLGHDFKVETPNIKEDSHKAYAAAYVAKYPCLKPFFLQLCNDLKFNNEQLIGSPFAEAKKSSAVQNPQLDKLNWQGKKDYRTNIIKETLATLDNGYYINSKGEKITFNIQPAIDSLSFESNKGYKKNDYIPTKSTIFLDNKDCLTVTRELAERGLNPIVLDAASDNEFGGGYMTGAGAQEENMCRRSGLSFAADTLHKKQTKYFYPLSKHGDDAGLYVSNVPVFRGEEVEGYPYLDKPFETAVAIIPAYNFNEEHLQRLNVKDRIYLENHQGELRLPEKQANGTKDKFRTVLKMAKEHGHDSVVLMPLGCGAFCQPPKHVSEILMQLISSEFSDVFKEIHISIIDDHNTGKQHNPNGNYSAFEQTMKKCSSKNLSIQFS